MRAFILKSDVLHYRQLVLAERPDLLEVVRRFDGTSLHSTELDLRIEVDDETISLPKADITLVESHIPVFSKRAIDALGDMLVGRGDIVSVSCSDGEYFAFNVTSLLNAMDTKSSDIKYFPNGKIMAVRSYVLHQSKISSPIFKLSQTPMRAVFVTDDFVEVVERAQLVGFLFEQVRVTTDNGFERRQLT